MAACEFTEFSFGYALTDSLSNEFFLGAAPVFPSLIKEGSAGGGYDVHLPAYPFPIFLQFKIQQVMVKGSSKRPPDYAIPYYRMPLRTRAPNQHALMLALEAEHPMAIVTYATPLFHRVSELDELFLSKQVHQSTDYFAPSWIGELDQKPHHVSYRPGETTYWLHSQPKPLPRRSSYVDLNKRITARLDSSSDRIKKRLSSRPADYRNLVLDESISSLKRAAHDQRGFDTALAMLARVRQTDSIEVAFNRLAYACQVHFGLTLMLTPSTVGND